MRGRKETAHEGSDLIRRTGTRLTDDPVSDPGSEFASRRAHHTCQKQLVSNVIHACILMGRLDPKNGARLREIRERTGTLLLEKHTPLDAAIGRERREHEQPRHAVEAGTTSRSARSKDITPRPPCSLAGDIRSQRTKAGH